MSLRTPEEGLTMRWAELAPDPEERAAVEEAVRRIVLTWETVDRHVRSGFLRLSRERLGVPTAEDAIDALARPFRRRVKLLDLALMEAAHRKGYELEADRLNDAVLTTRDSQRSIARDRAKWRRSA